MDFQNSSQFSGSPVVKLVLLVLSPGFLLCKMVCLEGRVQGKDAVRSLLEQ